MKGNKKKEQISKKETVSKRRNKKQYENKKRVIRQTDTFVLCSMILRDLKENLTNSNIILYYFDKYKEIKY